jgi:hypothetical protein
MKKHCGGYKASTPDVLWSKVDKRGLDECWPWKGRVEERAYQWGPDEHPRCQLTMEDAERIREMRLFGAKGRDLAKIFGVSPQTISAVNVGRYYSCR